MSAAGITSEAQALEYATRSVLQDQRMHTIALMVITEKLCPDQAAAKMLTSRILRDYRLIAQHGPSARDIHLAREVNQRQMRAFIRKVAFKGPA